MATSNTPLTNKGVEILVTRDGETLHYIPGVTDFALIADSLEQGAVPVPRMHTMGHGYKLLGRMEQCRQEILAALRQQEMKELLNGPHAD